MINKLVKLFDACLSCSTFIICLFSICCSVAGLLGFIPVTEGGVHPGQVTSLIQDREHFKSPSNI